jgi:cyclopropane fatty-acyl-phospholipid synthase-like methyltransferase
MNKEFNNLKTVWNNYGRNEAYWSVLTHSDYKPNLIKNNYEQFYKTGEEQIKYFENILQKHNKTLKDKIILDFGCGVGRLTNACSFYSTNVYGMDISEEHLKIARDKVKSAKFYIVNNINNLPKLPNNPEIIISLITLQHNVPRFIKKYLIQLLSLLKNEGIALIHIPYKVSSSLVNSPNKMQMHFLPKNIVRDITYKSKCVVLEEIDSNAGDTVFDTIYVIKKNNN